MNVAEDHPQLIIARCTQRLKQHTEDLLQQNAAGPHRSVKRPFVTLTYAQTLDGSIAAAAGKTLARPVVIAASDIAIHCVC